MKQIYEGARKIMKKRINREAMSEKKSKEKEMICEKSIRFDERMLNEFRNTVGRYKAETGGMIACGKDMSVVDAWRFDKKSKNTSTSYTYDVDDMTAVFHEWKSKKIQSVGFIHSHPANYKQPSYDDIATAYALMKFFGNDFFYLPIIISNKKGLYTLYLFVIRNKGNVLNVNLDYILQATKDGYDYIYSKKWNESYSVDELEEYYRRAINQKEIMTETVETVVGQAENEEHYFQRIQGMYPEHVLDKVNVVIGVGGARGIVENLARNGFRNFILIDGDIIAPSNIATQGVYISEMGMYKTEAIKNRILDINPKATVYCVNKMLDNHLSDRDFQEILNYFPNRKATDYLIYGCTDSFDANKRSSLLSLKLGIPYIGAGMYKEGLAAEVIFVYPGVTASCPRCLLRPRFEAYENEGYTNDVTSVGCPAFGTEMLNSLIGYLALIILMYQEMPNSPYNNMLDEIKDRNFVWMRLSPYLGNSGLGIQLFDQVFSDSKHAFMLDTLWIPQYVDSPENGVKKCKLCEGVGNLNQLKNIWEDTRKI